MKQQARSIQYTIRGVPREVDRALREKAARKKLSLNQVILEELEQAAVGKKRYANFSEVCGKLAPDPVFDEIIASQRQIDWEKWR